MQTTNWDDMPITDEYLDVDESLNRNIRGTFLQSVMSIFTRHDNLHTIFFAITKKLARFFSISGAVLAVHSKKDQRLKVIAMKKPSYSRRGLALSLPEKNSLLYSIYNNGDIYVEDFSDGKSGNFIERKLIFEDDTRSIAICPTYVDNSVNGLICFSSPLPDAFSMFERGLLKDVMIKMGKAISRRISVLNI